MVPDDKPERKMQHGPHGLIPAGILIGLGIGLLVNQPAAGVLIGLGCGFLASAFVPHAEPVPSADATGCCGSPGRNWVMLLLGVFMILIGIGLVWQPSLIWPYLIAALLILLGIGFTLRGIRRG